MRYNCYNNNTTVCICFFFFFRASSFPVPSRHTAHFTPGSRTFDCFKSSLVKETIRGKNLISYYCANLAYGIPQFFCISIPVFVPLYVALRTIRKNRNQVLVSRHSLHCTTAELFEYSREALISLVGRRHDKFSTSAILSADSTLVVLVLQVAVNGSYVLRLKLR